ncbi:hypothetical protein GA0115255_109101, partial [Streptomyces sp. Ncost-T6T-2b]
MVVQPQPSALGVHQGGAQPLVGAEPGHDVVAELGGTGEEFVDPYGEGPAARDARVVAEEPIESLGERRVARVPLQLRAELHRDGLRQIAAAEVRTRRSGGSRRSGGPHGSGSPRGLDGPRGLGVRDEPALHELLAGGQVVAQGRQVLGVRVGPGGPVEPVE